ncbi:MAG: large protein [Bacteroidota bacterium]|jgi:hypothetical protein|nr:large protein [Bacteroidota bacterium]
MHRFLLKIILLVFVFAFSKGWGQGTILAWDFEISNSANVNLPGGATTVSSSGITIASSACTGTVGYGGSAWNVGDYIQILAPTTGYAIGTLNFNVRASGTGPLNFKVQYSSTGSAGSFTDLTTFTSSNGTCASRSVNFASVSALNCNANVVIRLVFTGGEADGSPATGDAASGGTFRIDDLVLTGTSTACGGSCTPPTTTLSSTSQTVCSGSTASFSISDNATSSLYQWQMCATANGTYSNVINNTPAGATYNGATTNSLSITAGSSYFYRCLVTDNTTSCTATSSTASLTVNSPPSVTTPTISSTLSCEGSTNASVKINASGSSPLTYQWQMTNGGAYVDISGGAFIGETTGTLTLGNNLSSGNYSFQCIVSNSCGSINSLVSSYTVISLPAAPNVAPMASSVSCEPALITQNGTSPSGTNWYWQTSITGTSTNTLTSSTYSVFTNNVNYETYTVYVRAQSTLGSCWSSTSTPVSITGTVVNTPTVSSPVSTTVTPGATVQFTANATGGTVPGCNHLYQWQENSGSGFSNISNGGIYSGVTTATLSVGPVVEGMTGYTYRCVITSCACGIFTSNTASLTVSNIYTCLSEDFESGLPTSYTTNTVVLSSGTWSGTRFIRGNVIHSGSFACQLESNTGSNIITPVLTDPAQLSFWASSSTTSGALQVNYSSNGGSSWLPAPGSPFSLTTSYQQFTVNLNLSGTYILQFYRTAATVYLDDISVTCGSSCTIPTTTIAPVTQTICSGASATLSVSSSASVPSYTWQSSSNGTSGWSTVSNGTNVINVSPGSTLFYKVLVAEGGTCTATSSTAQVVVNNVPGISSQPLSVTTTSTGTAGFTVIATGAGLTYQWQENSGSGFTNISNGGSNPTYAGVTNSVLTISNPPLAMSGYSYQCIVTNLCGTSTTNGSAFLTVTMLLTCPALTSAVINSCDGCANEGNNEFLVLNTNSYSFVVNPTNVKIVYSNGNTNLTASFNAQPASLASLNTATMNSCGTTFVDVSNGSTTVPANSVLLIMNKGACFTGNWSEYCGLGNVYVAFSSVAAWSSTGFFGNNTNDREFVTDFSAVNTSCGTTTYGYNQPGIAGTPNGFTTDGAAVIFNGNSPPIYVNGNGNCSPPITILPIELLDFYGTQNGSSNELVWKVASEKDVSQYIIEKSEDGAIFGELTRINATGTEGNLIKYTCEDSSPFSAITYYRLSTLENNQTVNHYRIIDLDRGNKDWKSLIYQENNDLIIEWKNYVPKGASVTIFDLSGKELLVENASQPQTKIDTKGLATGIYFVRMSTAYKTENFKIVIQR